MQIRDATISDIPRLASLWFNAFTTLPDFNTVYPWRLAAPVDFRRLMTQQITDTFLQGAERYLVVEIDGQVVAWTSWMRKGSSDAARAIRAQNKSVLKTLELRLRGVEATLVRCLKLQHEEGPLAQRFGVEYARFVEGFWTGDVEEHWFMKKLCVDPAWRRQGVGMALLQWGLDRAREEGVVVGLDSTEEGMKLYLRVGFVQVAVFEVLQPDVSIPVLLWRPEKAESSVAAG